MKDIKIVASMVNVENKERNINGKQEYKIEGNPDVDKVFSEDDVLEIKVWDSKERPAVISDEQSKKISENLMRRYTENALNIKQQIKNDQRRKLNDSISK